MEVIELTPHDKAEWDAFVYRAPGATVYHLAGWKEVMEQAFGLECHYLLAREGGQILAVLPLLHVKSRLGGRYMTTPPGGLCCLDDQAAVRLLQHARQLVLASRARYLILRDSRRKWDLPELVTNEDHCTLVARLSPDWDQVLKGIKRKERQLTSQGMPAGAQVYSSAGHGAELASDGHSAPASGLRLLDSFYPAYLRAMRDKGTPTQGVRFFRHVVDKFPTHMVLMLVRRGAQVLGGGFIAPFQGTIYCAWAGMIRGYYDLRPSHLLYWETMRYGSANGFEWVDFGRSRWNSGTFDFKRSWGGEPRPLYQHYFLNGITQPPAVGSSRKEEAQYRVFVRLWQRMPLRVTEWLGPQLRRRMPFG